jgi:exopolysaccharide biosynthesis protein
MRLTAFIFLSFWCSCFFAKSQEYRTIADGVEYAQFTKFVQIPSTHNTTATASATESTIDAPAIVYALRVNGEKAIVRSVHAKDAAIGLETTSQLASRYNALAAVNAGFFRMVGLTAGDAAGIFQLNGKLLSEPFKERAACGLSNRNGRMVAVFGNVKWTGALALGNSIVLSEHLQKILYDRHALTGINRSRGAEEMLVFTPEFHRTTLTNHEGLEIIVEHGFVTAVRDSAGSSTIPQNGMVISCTGTARDWAKTNVSVGTPVQLISELEAVYSSDNARQTRRFRNAQSIVGGVSLLLTDGAPTLTWEREGATEEFAQMRHPRTAIGRMADGRLLLVAVDGRQLGVSYGMTLQELALLMKELGATDAMNLDGGGSTTMVVKGVIQNKPSDATGERPVSDALLVFPRTKN